MLQHVVSSRFACVSFLLLFFAVKTQAQILKKIKESVKDVQDVARQVNTTSQEVSGVAKTIIHTWKKDTSRNIHYQQVPDYRSREEVNISKKQKLSIENGEFKNLSWEPVTKFDNQLFPSFIIGWASYKGVKDEDMGSSLGFSINTNLPNVVLKWEIESADKNFFAIDSGYINCDNVRSTKLFMPRIAWNYRALTKNQTSAPLNVYFRLIDPNTGLKVEKLVNVNLRSINDCLTYFNGKRLSVPVHCLCQ
jgi:outer membrane lipoprotein-sorting protein